MSQSLESLIEELPGYFKPDAVKDFQAIAQLELLDDPVEYWFLTISNGQCTTQRGKANSPQLTLSAQSNDLLAIFSGELNITKAYMSGKINFSGNLNLAFKLLELFDLPEHYRKRLNIG